MASPKIGPNFFGKVNYENYVSELVTEGKIAGKSLSASERKEGFKKKGNKIQFESFVKKVLKKEARSSSPSRAPIGYLSGGSGGGRRNKSSSGSGRKSSTSLTKIVKNVQEKEPAGLDDLLNDIRRESPAAPKIKRDDKVVENLRESNKNLLETNKILMDLTKSLKKDLVEDKKRAFKEKDKLRKEQRKAALASSGVSRTGSSSAMRSSRGGGGFMDNPLMKFLGLSALAGLVDFIPKIIEFVETLPERINKFFTEDIPNFFTEKFTEFKDFATEKFEELSTFISGFLSDRFKEAKQVFEDIYTGIDEFTGGRLTEFIDAIKGLGPMIVEKSKEFYKTIDDWTGGKITEGFNWIGKNVIDPVGNFFKEKIDYVGTKAGELWTNFSSSFLNFFGDIKFELPEFPGLEESPELAIEGPDLTQDLVAVGGTSAANIAPISGAKGMAVEGMDASQVASQIPNMDVGGKSVQLGTGLSKGGTTQDVQQQISGLREGGAKGVQVLGTGDAEKDAALQEIVAQNKDFATFLPAVKTDTGGIDYAATAAAGTQQIQSNAAMREQASASVGAMSDNQRAALAALAKYESGAAGYDAVNQYGTKGGRGVEGFSGDIKKMPQHKGRSLTDMTLSEIKQLQYDDKSMSKQEWINAGKLHAVGRYQFIGNTLPGVAERAGIPDNAKFTPQVQDIMALQLMKERGISPWVGPSDKATAEERAIIELARTEPLPKVSIATGNKLQRMRSAAASAKPFTKSLLTDIDNVDAGVTDNAPGRKPVTASTPVTGQGSNPYGMVVTSEAMKQRSLGISSGMHMGVDIANGKEGAPLQAFTDGVITGNGTPGAGYGNWVSWTDTSGVEHFYAHMREKVPFNVGDKVKAGTKLGEVGNTGNSSGPHLHWETSTTPGDTGRPKGSKLSRFDPLSRYGFDAPFGGSTKPPENGTTKPKTSPAKVTPTPAKTPVSSVSETPSGSTANVSLVNLPPKVINNPAVISAMGGSGGESPAPIDVIPRVSTSTDEDIYNMHTRSIFNIVG